MNKKLLIGLGIGVGVVAVVGLVLGGMVLFRKNQEPDDIDDDEDDFSFDDYMEVEPDEYEENNVETVEEFTTEEDVKESINLQPELVALINDAGYAYSDFNDDQLQGLTYAFNQGYDVSSVIDTAYTGDQIVVIASGIHNGHDAKYFANPEFSYEQMLTIIQGLGNNVDVTKYNNPKYSVHQMTSILVGLLAGIDIDDLFDKNKTINLGNPNVLRKLIFEKISSNGKDPKTYLAILGKTDIAV